MIVLEASQSVSEAAASCRGRTVSAVLAPHLDAKDLVVAPVPVNELARDVKNDGHDVQRHASALVDDKDAWEPVREASAA